MRPTDSELLQSGGMDRFFRSVDDSLHKGKVSVHVVHIRETFVRNVILVRETDENLVLLNQFFYDGRQSAGLYTVSVSVCFPIQLVEEVTDLDVLADERGNTFRAFLAEHGLQIQQDIDMLVIAGVIFPLDGESEHGALFRIDILPKCHVVRFFEIRELTGVAPGEYDLQRGIAV